MDVGTISSKALADADEKFLQAMAAKARLVEIGEGDMVYVPALSAVWEQTEKPSAYISFKWLPSSVSELWRNALKVLLELKGWGGNEGLQRTFQTLQVVSRMWAEARAGLEV